MGRHAPESFDLQSQRVGFLHVPSATDLSPVTSDNATPVSDANRPPLARIRDDGQTASPAASPANPVHRFKYKGQSWTIRKRGPAADLPWYLVFERNKVRFSHSLGTANAALAVAEAKLRIDLHHAGRLADLRRAMVRPSDRSCSTVGEVLAKLPLLGIEASAKVRTQYAWSLRWVLTRALSITDPHIDALPLSKLNSDTGAAFFAWLRQESARHESQADANRIRFSARQIFNFTKALFSPRAVAEMTRLGLVIPDMTGWRRSAITAGIKVPRASGFQCPDRATVSKTYVEWIRIARTPGYCVPDRFGRLKPLNETARRNLFIAIGLELSCGLRKGEVKKARWRWFQRDAATGNARLCEYDVNVKAKTGNIRVRPLNPFWRVLNFHVDRNNWRGEPDDLVLEVRNKVRGEHGGLKFYHGGHCDADVMPFVNVGAWLRMLGWETRKTNHALRDLGASLVTTRYGLHQAKLWCRHSKLDTTERHYNSHVRDEDDFDTKRVAWLRWAR